MKSSIIKVVFSFIILSFFGCEPSSQNSTQSSESYVDEIPVEEVEIIFNEDEGDASQTRNFYFLFDGSGSMNESCSGERKIIGAQNAVLKFLDKIPEDVNLGLTIFGTKNSSGITEAVPIGSNNRNLFKGAILATTPQGGTPLGAATNLAFERLIEQYKKQLGYGEFRLIIVTDGMASNENSFKISLDESGYYPFISIYGIGLCIDSNHMLKEYSLSYTDAHDYNELERALEETIAELPDFNITDFNPDEYISE